MLKQESESQPKLLHNRLGPSTIFLGFGPVPAKILHADTCVTLDKGLKDATCASRSFLAKNWPRLIASHQQYCQKRAHCRAVCLYDCHKKKRSMWTSRPCRTGSATQLSMGACRKRSQAKASLHCLRHCQQFLDWWAQGSDWSCSSTRMLPFLGTNPQLAQGLCLVWWILSEPDGTRKKKKKKHWPPAPRCWVDCHVPSSSLHAQTTSLVELYTQPTVCGIVDVAIISPLALSKHQLQNKTHRFVCLCYHTVLLWFFGR